MLACILMNLPYNLSNLMDTKKLPILASVQQREKKKSSLLAVQ